MQTPAYGADDPTAAPRQRTTIQEQGPEQRQPQSQSPGRIGPYEVLQLLGEGGMGRVFLARSPGSRLVALKVIRPEYTEAPDFRGRFRREADAARKVSGFFTPPVLDADAGAEQPWLATAYIPAPSLHDAVARFGPLPEPALRALGAGLAEALLTIHAVGIVHRDLKPGNVLLAHDGPRVIDFGISRVAEATQVTRTNAVMGTPGFMAPEQIASSRETGPAADVFSLGCVLAFAATGGGPFGTGSTPGILYRAVHAPARLDGVPDALRPLVAACLDKEPARRPSVTALLTALGPVEPSALLTPGLLADIAAREASAAALLAVPPIPVDPPDTAAQGGPSRRRFLWIAAAGGTAVAAASATVLIDRRSKPGRTPGGAPGSAGTTIRPGAEVAAGPKPQWSMPLRQLQAGAHLELLGGTLVHWDKTTATGYDSATGQKRWTADPRVPSDVSGKLEWLGVRGSTLFASAWGGERGYLLGVDGGGTLRFTHAVTGPEEGDSYADSLHDVFSVARSVALIGTSGDRAYQVRAVDLVTGKLLWSHKVKGSDFHAYSDGVGCFLHDGSDVHGVDLRTGAVRWTVRDVVRPGDYPGLAGDGKALLLTSVKVQAFRASDGHRLWTAVNSTTTLNPTTVLGQRAYVVAEGQGTVFALDTGSGAQAWHTASPLPLESQNSLNPGPAVSTSLVAVPLYAAGDTPGFLVLRASDGKLLWAHQPSGAEAAGKNAWLLQAVGSTVYAASDTTLYAFRSDTP
ncbi:protein kinase [Streptomyces fildesensis]|uniref:Protein kinase n=1 Tax=Streptomyces fildesensis TaxID=375757 RepID=A0ABW8CL36_9ACTN